MYKCKNCEKEFEAFGALGGHSIVHGNHWARGKTFDEVFGIEKSKKIKKLLI